MTLRTPARVLSAAGGTLTRMLDRQRLTQHRQVYRGAQPYRSGARAPGATLDAMMRGGSMMGNPMDATRKVQRDGNRRPKTRRKPGWARRSHGVGHPTGGTMAPRPRKTSDLASWLLK